MWKAGWASWEGFEYRGRSLSLIQRKERSSAKVQVVTTRFLEWRRSPALVFKYRGWLQRAQEEVNEKEGGERSFCRI